MTALPIPTPGRRVHLGDEVGERALHDLHVGVEEQHVPSARDAQRDVVPGREADVRAPGHRHVRELVLDRIRRPVRRAAVDHQPLDLDRPRGGPRRPAGRSRTRSRPWWVTTMMLRSGQRGSGAAMMPEQRSGPARASAQGTARRGRWSDGCAASSDTCASTAARSRSGCPSGCAPALEHRGPTRAGSIARTASRSGIQRLRVIDLDTGDQPIYNEDRSVAVVLNGEIYNYRELRDELRSRGHRSSTKGDTEVIAHLYEEYGVDCVRRLHGMFAFALWDARRRRLLIARDRVGKKPLFYARARRRRSASPPRWARCSADRRDPARRRPRRHRRLPRARLRPGAHDRAARRPQAAARAHARPARTAVRTIRRYWSSTTPRS